MIDDFEDTSVKVKEKMLGEPAWCNWDPVDKGPGGKKELLMGMIERDPLIRWTVRSLRPMVPVADGIRYPRYFVILFFNL